MAIINFSSHSRAIQRRNVLNHNVAAREALLPRQPIGDNEDGQPIVKPLPVSVKVLTAFFVILGVLIVGECCAGEVSYAGK